MEIKDIRPMPKYIMKLIYKEDKMQVPNPSPYTRFYAYLAVWRKELVKVTVAVRHYRGKLYCKQVAVHGLDSNVCLAKDIDYGYLRNYLVGWYEEKISRYRNWYNTGKWFSCEDKYLDPYAPVVNKEVIGKFDEFKYSAYELYPYTDILKYLRVFRKYPQAEMLVKFGLAEYAMSVRILRLVDKDKKFRKWLISHKNEVKCHCVDAVIKAYRTGKPVDEVQRLERFKREFHRDEYNQVLKEEFKGAELEKLFNYLDKHQISRSLYKDYFTACKYIGLDMSIERNRYPHDFSHWHDVRIEEYRTMRFADEERERAEREERFKRELAERFEKFGEVAKKYLNLNKNGHLYSVIIAMSPSELVREGKLLHHCVGYMGYDRKFAEERSLIFFVRKSASPDTPFVTVEYSPENGKILQCYADHNSAPDEDVLKFINKTWLPYANRKLKQLQAA